MSSIDNKQIIDRLLKTDLTVFKNLSALFDMARNTNDIKLCKHVRSIASQEARKGRAEFYDLVKETYLWAAPYDLDSYLVYLEWNRPPEERFYLPRRKSLYQLVCALQDLVDDKLDELFLSMPPRVGKLLADSTPVLTTEGWKKHGDLKVGDYVFSPEGKPVRVLAVHPKYSTTHTVTMTDGSEFKCHYRHEWKVYNRRKEKVEILETKDMIGRVMNSGIQGKRGSRFNYQIVQREPIIGEEKELPVKPYTLGAWLGDGNARSGVITFAGKDRAVINRVVEDGYVIKREFQCREGVDAYSVAISGLGAELRSIGMCFDKERIEKHIPDEYLTASISQRLQLLAGLIDTDGYLDRKWGRYYYSTTDAKLKDSFISLVSTFGWRVSVKEEQPKVSTSGFAGRKVVYSIGFNPTMVIPCVLERKVIVEPKYNLENSLKVNFIGKWHLGEDLNMNYYCEK